MPCLYFLVFLARSTMVFLKIILFVYICLCWVFVAVQAFLKFRWAGAALSSWGALASHYSGFFLLRSTGSRAYGLSSCSSRAPEHRLNSCGAEAWLVHSMWDLPGSEIASRSSALAGGFFTTEHQGSQLEYFYKWLKYVVSNTSKQSCMICYC